MHSLRTNSGALLAVESFLRRTIGLDPETIGRAAVDRAVRARMEACGTRQAREFVDRLTHDDVEQARFIEEVVVPESWFFRDPQVFGFISQFVLASATAPGRPPIRILSAPCAAGEEPYSVAISLLEAGLDPSRFQIEAADVSHAALAKAHEAVYSANAFRTEDRSFRDRWFHVTGPAVRLDDSVRRQVQFFHGNLLDESFAATRAPYDVVFCRNLLIYLTPEARARIDRLLDRLLVPDGLLVLGAAEPPILRSRWTPASGHSVFVLRRGVGPASGPAPSSTTSSPARSEAGPRRPAVEAVGSPLSAVDSLLREAEALADAGRHAEALLLCHGNEPNLPPCPRLFFLMGMLHQAIGDLDRAEGCLHKTLYLDADHDEALMALSLVATRRGDSRMAETYRQSAARAARRKGVS